MTPAAATTASRPPKRSTIISTVEASASGERTSATASTIAAPAAPAAAADAAAAEAARSSRVATGWEMPSIGAQMSDSTTDQPAAANPEAVAAPIPLAAPVIQTTRSDTPPRCHVAPIPPLLAPGRNRRR